MAAATHVVGSTHSSSTSSSISPPPPWHPVVLVPTHQQQQQTQVLHDLDLLATPPAATASPARPRHNHLRPAASASRQRAAGKGKQPRRPRPSRKLPTTYISADAASFRRMVHQVTGFDDDVTPLHLPPGGGHVAAEEPEVLCCHRQAPPSRAGLETMLLPTLDTSAFLMLGAAGCDRGRGGGGATPARPAAGVSCCHGSSAAAEEDRGSGGVRGGGGEYSCSNGSAGGGGGFTSWESWDDDALYLEFQQR